MLSDYLFALPKGLIGSGLLWFVAASRNATATRWNASADQRADNGRNGLAIKNLFQSQNHYHRDDEAHSKR